MPSIAYVITGANELTAVEPNTPDNPVPLHATVEITLTGICSSDIDAFRKGYPYPPTLSGHEWAGVVVAIGENVKGLAVGDRVARTCQPPCGDCRMCRAGHQELCDFFSLGSLPTAPNHGAYTTHIQVPATSLITLPDSVTDEQGAMVEPAAVAFHAVGRSKVALGDTVLLIGAGLIGLFALQIARLSGAVNVVVIEPDEERRQIALELGATGAFAPGDERILAALLDVTDGRGADVAYECAGQGSSLMDVIPLLRPGGRLMMISAPSARVEVIPAMWTVKELDIQTSLAHTRDEFDIVVDLLARGLLRTTGIRSEVVPLSELPEVFGNLADFASAHRILVDPRR